MPPMRPLAALRHGPAPPGRQRRGAGGAACSPWAWSFSSIAARPTATPAATRPPRRTSPPAAPGRHAPGIRRHGKTAAHAGQRLRLSPDRHGRPLGRRAAAEVRRGLPHLRRRAPGVARPAEPGAGSATRRASSACGRRSASKSRQCAAPLRRRRRHALRLRLAVRPAGHRLSRVRQPRQNAPKATSRPSTPR